MTEPEMITLTRELKEAASTLDCAIRESQDALENMQEFWPNDPEPRLQFDWFISHGFIPGAKFTLNNSKDKIIPVLVKSYSYNGGQNGGAVVIFEYVEEEETKTSGLQYSSILKMIDRFEVTR